MPTTATSISLLELGLEILCRSGSGKNNNRDVFLCWAVFCLLSTARCREYQSQGRSIANHGREREKESSRKRKGDRERERATHVNLHHACWNTSRCVCIYIYIYIYANTYTYIYIYICTHICIYVLSKHFYIICKDLLDYVSYIIKLCTCIYICATGTLMILGS